jgi:hypothetical protein
VGKLVGLSIADYQICFAPQDGLHQPRYICGAILIVRVGIDDDVSTQADTSVKASRKSAGEPAVARHSCDMVNPRVACNDASAVGTTIVNHEYFDAIYPLYAARQVSNRRRKVLAFIVAGDLND